MPALGAKEAREREVRPRQSVIILVIDLLIALTVACVTPGKQPNSYGKYMTLCSDEFSDCAHGWLCLEVVGQEGYGLREQM
jgi:hypothetical protein